MPTVSNKENTSPDLSIVLVGWNNKAYLDPCLTSLYESGLKCSFDVVVVDNGSTDGSQEMLRESIHKLLSYKTIAMLAWVKQAIRVSKQQRGCIFCS